MKTKIKLLVAFWCVFLVANSQNNSDLVLQNFHSGYEVKLIDTDSSGEYLVSYGSDKELIFYNINKRVIYKRVSITGKVEIKAILINNNNQTLITLQSNGSYPDSSFLITYQLKDATISNVVHVNPLADSLKVSLNSGNFIQINYATNELWLIADVLNNYFTKTGYLAFSINLNSNKISSISSKLASTDQLNCFQLINNHLWMATSTNLFILNSQNTWISKWNSVNHSNEITASFKSNKKGGIWLLTNNFFSLLDETSGNILKKHPLNEVDHFKRRNHPFAVSSSGEAFYVSKQKSNHNQINSKKLYVFSNEKTEEIVSEISFDFVEDMVTNDARNIVFISSSDKVFCVDYLKKREVFTLNNSISLFQNISFIEPGIAHAVTKFNHIPVRINFANCTIKKEPLEQEIFRAEQIQILPNSKIKIVKDGCGINFFSATSSTFLYRIVPYLNKISEEPKSKKISENCSFTGLNNFYTTSNEQYLIIPAYYPKLCIIQIYDIQKKQLKYELDLRPSKNDTKQIINHIALHKKLPIIYVETFNNNFGGLQSFLINVETGKIVWKKDYSNSMVGFDYCGSFNNHSSTILLPENILYNYETNSEVILNIAGEKPVFSNDDQFVFFIRNDYIYRYHFATKEMITLGYHHYVKQLIIDPNSSLLVSVSSDKQTLVWNTQSSTNLYKLLATVPIETEVQPSYIFILPNGYFTGGGNYSSFIIKNEKGYILPYEEFDRLFNRPDQLLASTGLAKPKLIAQLNQIVEKRISANKTRITSFEASIINTFNIPLLTNDNSIDLKFKHNSSNVSAYQIWVNGTALFLNEGKKIINKTATVVTEKIAITDKLNRIEVCFYDDQKNESNHDYIVVNKITNEKPALWVVTLGIANYKNSNYNLTYASKDAEDLANVLAKSTSFTRVNVSTIINEDVNKNALQKIEHFLQPAKPQDVVLCFFAGHGVLDKKGNYFCSTYDIDLDNPEINGIPIEQFENVLNKNTARKKILLIDACNSGLIDEVSGFTKNTIDTINVKQTGRGVSLRNKQKETTELELLQSVFLNLNKGAGLTIIAASAGTEFAYEDAKYKNGLFTYALLSALKSGKGDLNKDQSITVSELKHYVEQQVQQLSQGKQRPTNRRFNNYSDFELWQYNDREKGQLFTAASKNDTLTIQQLIATGYDVDEEDEQSGFTALHYAARQNAVYSLQWLLKKGAAINKATKLGFRPISLAVVNNHAAATYLLLSAKAKTDSTFIYSVNDAPKTLLQIADLKQFNHISFLLKNELFIQEQHQYLSSLFNIILDNTTTADVLDKQLTQLNPAINFVVPDINVSKTLILLATVKGDTAKVKVLLKHGAMIGRVEFSDFAPLHLAAFMQNKTMVQFLLANGADKNEKSSQNKKPIAYLKDDKELAELLKD
jgi:ankyrin repeat protein